MAPPGEWLRLGQISFSEQSRPVVLTFIEKKINKYITEPFSLDLNKFYLNLNMGQTNAQY